MIYRANVFLATLLSSAVAGTDRLRREEGQTFVEYALVILLIAVAIGVAATWDPMRDAIEQAVLDIKSTIENAP
jgi:Flp pilus assembly pilin Flp